jgi:hypothetical protein
MIESESGHSSGRATAKRSIARGACSAWPKSASTSPDERSLLELLRRRPQEQAQRCYHTKETVHGLFALDDQDLAAHWINELIQA